MKTISDACVLLALAAAMALACGPGSAQRASRPKEQARVSDIEVIAGESIGPIRLGMKKAELPSGTKLEADISGEFQGIHFMLDQNVVSEVWIPNLRAFPTPIRFNGHTVARDATGDVLKKTFGPCTRIEGVIGGTRYQCTPGVALGFDFEESGAFVQLRVQTKR
jgi:hypothetical protein